MSGFDELRRELMHATARQAPARSRAPRLGWKLRAGAAAFAAACALVALLALLPSGASRTIGPAAVQLAGAAERRCARPAPTPKQSAACLAALGAVADAWQVPGSGNVLYLRQWWGTSAAYMTRNGGSTARPDEPGSFMVQRGAEQELWIRPDGSGESLQHGEEPPQLASAADRAAWRAAGQPALIGGQPVSGDEIAMMGPGSARQRWSAGEHAPDLFPVGEVNDAHGRPVLLPDGDPLKVFTADPAALARQVRLFAWRQRIELSGEPGCSLTLGDCSAATRSNIRSNEGTIAVGLLRYPLTPRALRAAVLRMLAGQAGYRTLGSATDPRGRRGVAVLLPRGSNDGQDVLLIDTATARLIAIGASRDRTLFTTRWHDLLGLETHLVERVGERP